MTHSMIMEKMMLMMMMILLLAQMFANDVTPQPGCRRSTLAAGYENGYTCSNPPARAFQGHSENATALRLLVRSRNVVEWLTISLPSWLPHLELLQLDVARITSLPPSVFNRLPKLRQLQLFRTVDRSVVNRTVDRSAMSPTELPTIKIEINIGAGVFDGLSEVNTLILSDLELTQINPGVLRGLTNLMVLNLNHNNLTRIPRGTFDECCRNLSVLTIATNNIVSMRDLEVSELRSLLTLDVRENFLVSLTSGDLDSLENLNSINLADNRLVLIERGSFSELGNLRVVDLRGNRLSATLDGSAFIGLSRLRSLNLGGNELGALHQNLFADQSMLRTLILSSCDITDIPTELFARLNNLEELDLSNNSLRSIDSSMFKGLSNLRRMRLDKNQISDIGARAFSNLNRLEEVNVRENQLRYISSDAFAIADNRITLDLSDNPWNCECGLLSWLYPEINLGNNDSKVRVEPVESVVCSSPAHTVGKTVQRAMKEFCNFTDHSRTITELTDLTTVIDSYGFTENVSETRTLALTEILSTSDDISTQTYKTISKRALNVTSSDDGAKDRVYGLSTPDSTVHAPKQLNMMLLVTLSVTFAMLAIFVLLTVFLIRHANRVQQLYPVEDFEEGARSRSGSRGSR